MVNFAGEFPPIESCAWSKSIQLMDIFHEMRDLQSTKVQRRSQKCILYLGVLWSAKKRDPLYLRANFEFSVWTCWVFAVSAYCACCWWPMDNDDDDGEEDTDVCSCGGWWCWWWWWLWEAVPVCRPNNVRLDRIIWLGWYWLCWRLDVDTEPIARLDTFDMEDRDCPVGCSGCCCCWWCGCDWLLGICPKELLVGSGMVVVVAGEWNWAAAGPAAEDVACAAWAIARVAELEAGNSVVRWRG